jgi:hypothetical protein
MRKTTIALAILAGLGLAAPADAAIRKVPQQFPTIQDAVDASNPGDVIEVSKKRNNEGVDVTTNNLVIKGVKPGVVVDSYINGSGDDYQFDIAADNVRIANLGFRNGDGFYCVGNGCSGKKLRFSGENNSQCYYAGGNRARITRSSLINCGGLGAEIAGDDAKVVGNTVKRTDSGCIQVTGDDATVRNNRGNGCEDSDGIEVDGDRALVEDNAFRSVDGEVVDVDGDGARVLGNRGGNAYDNCYLVTGDRAKVRNNAGDFCDAYGVEAAGQDPKITGNRLTDSGDYGMSLDCSLDCDGMEVSENVVDGANDDLGIYVTVSVSDDGLLIARNVVRGAGDEGLYLDGIDNSRIVGNLITGNGSGQDDSVYLAGSGNVFIGNRVLNGAGDGFGIYGPANRFEDNLVRGNGGDGYYVSGYADTVLVRNVAIGNGADGIENDGTDTVLRKNRSSGNHRDCANDGTIAVKQGNQCADGSNFNLGGTASRIGR